jgi:mRNA interferase RelE/StbE
VRVEFRNGFAKDLKRVKENGVLSRVREVIEAVERGNSLSDFPHLKKLKGGGNYFRIRVGDYRIGLILENDTIVFVRFLNRKEIYKYFP